ncbi:uncharacterized protein LOC143350223 [Colletes latitarsis]|uniref:uncharacterized protein LOC143350223 n=1 Tax=Colletes latitarsis TaxID=2605962 RepID=UPI004036FDF7
MREELGRMRRRGIEREKEIGEIKKREEDREKELEGMKKREKEREKEMIEMKRREGEREKELESRMEEDKKRERENREEMEKIMERERDRDREIQELRGMLGAGPRGDTGTPAPSKRKIRSPPVDRDMHDAERRVRRKGMEKEGLREGERGDNGPREDGREQEGTAKVKEAPGRNEGASTGNEGEWVSVTRRGRTRIGSTGVGVARKEALVQGGDWTKPTTETGARKRPGGKADTPRITGPRTEAICVTAGAKTYAEVFKEIAGKAKTCLENIKVVRKSRKGELIVEFTKAGSAARSKDVILGNLGEEYSVRAMVPRTEVEIRDLDPICEATEVLEGFCSAFGIEEKAGVRVKTLRYTYLGTQIAVLELPTALAAKVDNRKVKIGYTVVRISIVPRVLRCFRCHAFGHISYGCGRKDIGRCRKCGEEGHEMRDCTKDPSCVLCREKGMPADRTRLAQDLLLRAAEELRVDLVAIAEPYLVRADWVADISGRAAIWDTGFNGRRCKEDKMDKGNAYVAVEVEAVTVASCYYRPRLSGDEFAEVLGELEESRGNWKRDLVLAGDFNAKSPAWGSRTLDVKGGILMELLARMGLEVADTREEYTYEKAGRTSKIDVMACNKEKLEILTSSDVLAKYTASDHLYLLHVFAGRCRVQPADPGGWRVDTLDAPRMLQVLDDETTELDITRPMDLRTIERALDALVTACDASMEPRRAAPFYRATKIWWTREIAELRARTNKCRRRYQRAARRGRPDTPDPAAAYKEHRKLLNKEIVRSKIRAWRELCGAVEGNVWGCPYKAVMKAVRPRKTPPELTEEKIHQILEELFPAGGGPRTRGINLAWMLRAGMRMVSEEEIRVAAKNVKFHKAPGRDLIPGVTVRVVVENRIRLVKSILDGCIQQGKIPGRWKEQRLVLLHKEGRDPNLASAYRPLCLISHWAKLSECVLRGRIQEALGPRPYRVVLQTIWVPQGMQHPAGTY